MSALQIFLQLYPSTIMSFAMILTLVQMREEGKARRAEAEERRIEREKEAERREKRREEMLAYEEKRKQEFLDFKKESDERFEKLLKELRRGYRGRRRR